MHSQRQCYPLVFLHTAIVMGIQISQICVLIKRILLNIKTRGVNMCTKNAHAFGKLLCSHMKQSYDLLHANCINLIASLDLVSSGDLRLKCLVACCLCLLHDLCNALALCFTFIEKLSVSPVKLLHLIFICFLIGKPCVSSFHLMVHLSSIRLRILPAKKSDSFRFSSYYLQSVYYYRSNNFKFPPQFPFFTKSL